MKQEYKYIILDDEKSYFRIYENGRVMSEKTGNYYKGTIRGGYRWFDLRFNGKKYSRSQHRLIAEAFIPNPENLEYVHHKDGNRLNNEIANLEWVSASENNLGKNRRDTGIDHSDYREYKDEELWRTFRDTRYMVSTWGRVKNAETGKLLKGKITNSGYREFCLTFNNKKNSLSGHRITYEVWKPGEELMVINHIDGNKLNNHILNLENVTSRENNMKAIYETKVKRYKQTAQYDLEGNLIRVYQNNAEAARVMGVRPQSIQQAIKKGTNSCGFKWKNLE